MRKSEKRIGRNSEKSQGPMLFVHNERLDYTTKAVILFKRKLIVNATTRHSP